MEDWESICRVLDHRPTAGTGLVRFHSSTSATRPDRRHGAIDVGATASREPEPRHEFSDPLYILGLAAISLPILFHLIRRTPKGMQPFSSLMFVSSHTSSPDTAEPAGPDLLLLLLRSSDHPAGFRLCPPVFSTCGHRRSDRSTRSLDRRFGRHQWQHAVETDCGNR